MRNLWDVSNIKSNTITTSSSVSQIKYGVPRIVECGTMQKYETQLKLANEELAKQHFLLQKDVDVLKKYVGFFYRLKLKFSH